MKIQLKGLLLIVTIIISTTVFSQLDVDSNGDVGIGTTSQNAKLDVRGDVIINDNATSTADVRMESDTDTALFFLDASTNYIGIGTQEPERKLHISQGDAGSGSPHSFANLVVEHDSHAMIEIHTDDQSSAYYAFSHEDDNYVGGIKYSHPDSAMWIAVNNANVIHINKDKEVGIGGNAVSSYGLYVTGDIYCTGSYLPSDINLKTGISDLENVVDKLNNIRGVSYNYVAKDVMLPDSSILNLPEGNQYGLLAQEVQEVFPELVRSDQTGYLSINYIGLIPHIIEAFKEQHSQIETLEAQVTSCCTPKARSSQNTTGELNEIESTSENILYQNTPNPFSESTSVKYIINSSNSEGNIYIFNMNGTLIKSYPVVGSGEGEVIINSGELVPGMYMYSLVINDNIIDTKNMILTD